MPRRPAKTGYERLAQADHSDDSDDDPLVRSFASVQPASAASRHHTTSQPRPVSGMATPMPRRYSSSNYLKNPRKYRQRTNSGVDLKAINARLERWADEIASRFKRNRGKGKPGEADRLEIHHSVFQAPEGVRPITAEGLAEPQPGVMTREEFSEIVESVRLAIEQGVHPTMISQGSSGSYFARNPAGKVVAVFKPKDEEPYAAGNPKWNKWIHRNLFPCCFGRACLIPNLSYVSEAAAYTLDCQLRTRMVPYTDVVYLSSRSFHYPFWDRHSFYRRRKPLPEKPGSFQVFLKGFKDANVFLRENPWPDQYYSGYRANDPRRTKSTGWTDCTPRSRATMDAADDNEEEESLALDTPLGPNNFVWTHNLKQSFREELEKLVILDYIMRNTDRGLDNWMVKVDWESQHVSIVSDRMHMSLPNSGATVEDDGPDAPPRPVSLDKRNKNGVATRTANPYETQQMTPTNESHAANEPKITIGAIDNSLSWPWKHPDGWRSFPFGWLFLPVDLIGRPFSQKTRDHFLPLLTSTVWWSETQLALRKVFKMDPDFQERMFAKQIAVMKGQAWNVVETLKTADHGPLELTRRSKVCVWDDLVDVPVAAPMRLTADEPRVRPAHQQATPISQRLVPTRSTGLGSGDHDDFVPSGDLGVVDELDIGASTENINKLANADDLLALVSPRGGSNSARFEMSSSPVVQSPDAGAHTSVVLPDGGDFSAHVPSTPAASKASGATPSVTSAPSNIEVTPLSTYNKSSPLSRQESSGGGGVNHSVSKRPRVPGPSRSLNIYSEYVESASSGSGGGRASAAITTTRRSSYAPGSGPSGGGARRKLSTSLLAQQLSGGPDGGFEGEDDIEGDLGYAAAEGMEGQLRKVIVERLEPVKSTPVFTCW